MTQMPDFNNTGSDALPGEVKVLPNGLIKKTVPQWLKDVDYGYLHSPDYRPSKFALEYVEFIKLVNGKNGEAHHTPPVHYAMLDQIAGKRVRLANLCSRGLAKTTLFCEYFVLYLALYGHIEGFGEVNSMMYIANSMEKGVADARKNIEERYNKSEFLQEYVPYARFTENYMEFKNAEGKKFGVKMFGAHTSVRGTKILTERPVIAVMDDIVSDEDARSKVAIERINNTIYKAVQAAMDPQRKKMILCGTPFGKTDPVYRAIESGGWHVNCFPVAEKFPCEEHEFRGAWPARFSWSKLMDDYQALAAVGKIADFRQEYMLDISSDEERLVMDDEIRWYKREEILGKLNDHNIFITTDFAYSEKQNSDYSVISVWACNYNGDFYWIDGMCERGIAIADAMEKLFKLCYDYRPMSVGIEISGQQSMLIGWIMKKQREMKIYFNLARQGGRAGIRPSTNKLTRFQMAVPLFKQGKMFFPADDRYKKIMQVFYEEISLATISGFKSTDDCADTISMLTEMQIVNPTGSLSSRGADMNFGSQPQRPPNTQSPMKNYIV